MSVRNVGKVILGDGSSDCGDSSRMVTQRMLEELLLLWVYIVRNYGDRHTV